VRILTRYLSRAFFSSYLVCLFFFLGLFLVIQFFERIDDYVDARKFVGSQGANLFALVLTYNMTSVPIVFIQIAPFVTLMGAMFAVTRLARANELIPVVTSGVSLYRFLFPIFVYGAAAALVMIFVQEKVVPGLALERQRVDRIVAGKHGDFVEKIPLLRDSSGNLLSFRRYDPRTQIGEDVNVTRLGPPPSTITADRATYRRDGPRGPGWYLENGVEQTFDGNGDPVQVSADFADGIDISPFEVMLSSVDKATLSFTELNALFRKTPDSSKLRVLLHHRLTFPMSNLVLLLLGLPIVLNRNVRNLVAGIGLSIVVCGAFFAADFVMQDLGARGTLHPVVAAWLPTIFFGSLGICLFDTIRT
jgi:LPS export ABC transporter permease LptG